MPKQPEKRARCFHKDSLQFTGSRCSWCPACGSARIFSGTLGEGVKARWKAPANSDARQFNAGRPTGKADKLPTKKKRAKQLALPLKRKASEAGTAGCLN